VRVSQERALEGRLFQMAGTAERKPRASNEMLQRVTDRRLAEADLGVLHGVCHWTRLAKYGGGVTGMYSFMGHCGDFEFNTTVNLIKFKIATMTHNVISMSLAYQPQLLELD